MNFLDTRIFSEKFSYLPRFLILLESNNIFSFSKPKLNFKIVNPFLIFIMLFDKLMFSLIKNNFTSNLLMNKYSTIDLLWKIEIL